MSEQEGQGSNRRRAERHEVYIAAEIEQDSAAEGQAPVATRSAVTRDVSESGLLLLTRADLAIGEHVRVRVYLPGEERAPRRVSGRVVRHEPLDEHETGMWKVKVAVQFDAPSRELGEVFVHLAERQADLFKRRPT